MVSLLNLKEIKETKDFIIDTLHNFKDDVKSVASNISAKDITALGTSPGPAVILSVGLPLIGVYLAKKKRDSPLARKIARFLGADVNSINEQFVFDKLNNTEYYNELRKNVLSVITERGDISPLTKMVDLTEGEAWEIFNTMKEIIFSAEVLNQFSIILPSLKNIEKEVGNVRSNLNSLLEALKSPIKVSSDVDNITNQLSIHESAGVSYIHREEDSQLEQAILNNDNKIILIIGGPGSGKSKMLYNALLYCKEYFSTFILLKYYFREGDEKSLDLALGYNDMDNFVIVWDDLHEKKPDFVTDVIERINSISRPKNFRFIGASRKDIFVKGEDVYRLNLHRFDKIGELVSECAKAFNVKLKIERDVAYNKMLNKGDGTPYYTISLFKIFKDHPITLRDLDQLPSDVTDLWRKYLDKTIQNSRINTSDLNTFRSIGLLSHSSETSRISKDRIYEIYDSVFHGDLGELDYALDDLVNNMFVSRVDEGYYYAHDSHIEALESKYPLEKYHVQNFTKYESDSRNLGTFANWANYKWKMEYLEIICSRILELNPNDVSAWQNKAYALSQLGRYEEAILSYDKVLELNPNHILARINKGSALFNLSKYEEAIKYFDEALELKKDEEPLVIYYDKDTDYDKDTGRIKPGVYNLKPDPEQFAIWFNKGLALFQLGRYEEAIVSYDKALELDRYNIDAWGNKAYALSQLGRYEEEVMCYDKVLELIPNHVYAWYKKASSNIKQKNIENGLASLKKAIEIDKKYIQLAKQDKDFESLRNDDRFKDLILNENT